MRENSLELFKRMSRGVGNPLEWSSCSKASLVGGATCFLYLIYAAWIEVSLTLPADQISINASFVASQKIYILILAFCSFFLFIGPLFLQKITGDSVLYEYISTLYFAFSLCYFGYLIGTLTLPVGAVMVGAPLVGFIFFNRKAVIFSLTCAMLVQITLSIGAAQQWWLYGPFFNTGLESESAISLFMVFNMYFFMAPHMIILIFIAYLVLRRWRDREDKVRHLSVTDPLTGLFNRRSILAQLDHEQERSRKKGPVLSVLMVDLDRFKEINDNYGHEAGDYALIAAASALQKSLRQNDRVGRYGGEEFLIILPGTDTDGAKMIAERCRQQLENNQVLLQDGVRVSITGSFGLLCNEGDVKMHVDEMLRQADKAMYSAKSQGRNCVVVA